MVNQEGNVSNQEDFETALDGFLIAYQELVQAEPKKRGWFNVVHASTFEADNRTTKYVRVTQTRHGGGRSVYAFVRREDGAIMYPAGWRGPATKPHGVRGNIYSADHGISCCGPFGMKTLR